MSRHIERVKEILSAEHPAESERIAKGDAAFLSNRFLQNDCERSRMSLKLGLGGSKCGICIMRNDGAECPFEMFPLNRCRNGIISWLEAEAD